MKILLFHKATFFLSYSYSHQRDPSHSNFLFSIFYWKDAFAGGDCSLATGRMPLRASRGSNLGEGGGHRGSEGLKISYCCSTTCYRLFPSTSPPLTFSSISSNIMVCGWFTFCFVVGWGFLTQALSTEIGFGQNSGAQPCLPSLLMVWLSILFLCYSASGLILPTFQGGFDLNLPHLDIQGQYYNNLGTKRGEKGSPSR